MDRFGRPNKETDHHRRAREARRGVCPICEHTPCQPGCKLGFTREELDDLLDHLLYGKKTSKKIDPETN